TFLTEEQTSSSFRLETAPVPAELENLQLISAILGESLPNGQTNGKNSSSTPQFGRKCENELEKFQFVS
ncbi:hypothetical protein, partial [Paenibacillus ferrarius]|uniref:hypothetical protein n=1 Tax=Paenibacillus ferrarius TaxID=1469647 RepID=UPI003D29C8BF